MNKVYWLAFAFFIQLNYGIGANIIAVSSGNWSTNNTWNCNCQPGSSDNVTIPNGITVTNATARSFFLGPVIILKVAGKLLLVNSSLSYDASDVISIISGGQISGAGILGGLINSGFSSTYISSGSAIDGPRTITNGVLPVRLLFFKGYAIQENVILEWASASEKNFNYYTIEKSYDGKLFEAIANIAGTNHAGENHYSYDDGSFSAAKIYYRLKAIDIDGATEILSLIMVDNNVQAAGVTVFPNPLDDQNLNIRLHAQQDYDYEIIVFDSRGSLIMNQSVEKEISLSTLQLPCTSEKYYLVLVKSQGSVFTTSVLVK